MGDVLDGVAKAVGVVVRRVDAPLVAGPMVSRELDAIGNRVLLSLLQSDLHPQRGLALVELAVLHVLEKLENERLFRLNNFSLLVQIVLENSIGSNAVIKSNNLLLNYLLNYNSSPPSL